MIQKSTVESFFRQVKSGIGLDVAKNHTGICIWNGESVETYGFALSEYDKGNPFAEYKMRREFKQKLSEIVKGRTFEFCIIEDVYGGDNFDTVRKLLALNTVIDELIFDGVCYVDHFDRWGESVWMKNVRTIYKQRGRLKSKIELQGILEFLEFPFYMGNKDKSDPEKADIFFEDICDATGILLARVVAEIMNINVAKQSSLRMSDIKMVYVQYIEDTFSVRDKRVKEELYLPVELNYKKLEQSILASVSAHPDDVLIASLPSSKLGVFGTKHNFKFYSGDEAYLIFYKR